VTFVYPRHLPFTIHHRQRGNLYQRMAAIEIAAASYLVIYCYNLPFRGIQLADNWAVINCANVPKLARAFTKTAPASQINRSRAEPNDQLTVLPKPNCNLCLQDWFLLPSKCSLNAIYTVCFRERLGILMRISLVNLLMTGRLYS
jgi:hypothetical protein